MALMDGEKANLQTIIRAAATGDLALLECTDKKTGERVSVVCAVHMDGEEYIMTPMAKMFKGNPYEEVDPPHD